MTKEPIDLGHGHLLRFTVWRPDRELNPQYDGIADIDPIGAIIDTGNGCESAVFFDVPGVRDLFPDRAIWTVESWDPLTLSPSLLCTICKDHGFVREGRWVPA